MLAFYPEFETTSSDVKETEETGISLEVVFVIDMSNSMKGNAIQDAIIVVLLALHHLPSTSLFNVVKFGTSMCEKQLIMLLFTIIYYC